MAVTTGEHGGDVVPAFYYTPEEPDDPYRWDGSEEAWAWKQVLDIRDEALVEGAARTLSIMGTFGQLPDVMVNAGWATEFERQELGAFLGAHEADIKRRVEGIRRARLR